MTSNTTTTPAPSFDSSDLTKAQIDITFADMRPHFRPQACACIGKAKYTGDSRDEFGPMNQCFTKGTIYPVYEGPKPEEYMVIGNDGKRKVFYRNQWEIKLD